MLDKIKKAFNSKIIDGITLFTAPTCNLNCIYCFSDKRREAGTCIKPGKWQSIIYQAKEMGARWVAFAGPGEPLLGDTTLNLIEYANSLAMRSIIFTNGILVKKKTAKFLYEQNVRTTIKVHSFNPRTYDFLAGKDNATEWADYKYSYKGRVLHSRIPLGLKVLLDEAEGFSQKQRRRFLELESVITKYNLSCLIDIARFAKAHKLDILLETLIAMDGKNIRSLVPSNKEYLSIYNELSRILGWKFIFNQRRPGCGIRKNPVVWENGDMALCFIEEANIGSIHANALRDLWTKRLKVHRIKLQNKSISGFRNCLGREYSKKFM